MKISKSKLTTLLLICITAFVLLQPVSVNAATWYKNNNGWWLERDNGSYPANCWEKVDNKWYYFDEKGYMKTDWLFYNNYWYYFGKDGAMKTGWQVVNSIYYYFQDNGRMTTDSIVDKIYYVDENGRWDRNHIAGEWIRSGNQWWYCHLDGSYTTNNWEKIAGKWYYFDKKGYMLTGWICPNNVWYYLESNGAMATEKWVGNYYLTTSGVMATNQWIDDRYYVDSTGKWNPNTYRIDLGNGDYTNTTGVFKSDFEDEVIRLVNEYRISNGLNPLEKEENLSKQADIRSCEIVYSFSHTRPNGESCFSLIKDSGYKRSGENIAAGHLSPQQVFDAWKNSPGHNANMLKPEFTLIGVSCFYSSDSTYLHYWVQYFGDK